MEELTQTELDVLVIVADKVLSGAVMEEGELIIQAGDQIRRIVPETENDVLSS